MIDFCGIALEHEVINGSGTFDAIAARRAFGDELLERFPFSAFVSKTITMEPRAGNPPPRLYETLYACAVEVAAADLHVEQEELVFLQMLRDDLDIDPLVVAAIERSARVRYRVK